MPRPQPHEPEKKFVSRYMGSPEAQAKFKDQKQRLAVAYSLFNRKGKPK